jgi:hypothetical protein
MTKIVYTPSKPPLLLSIIFIQCVEEIGNLGRGEGLTLGLAVALATSAIINLAFLISPRTRDILMSAGRWLIGKVQAVRANPNANPTLPDPPADFEAPKEAVRPPPPAVVWPTVRPSAPAPPPRHLYYGAKGIFETGKKIFYGVPKIFETF